MIRAVQAVSLGVARGSITALVGSNGAGKSSTLRAIAGLVKPRSGAVLAGGHDVSGLVPRVRVIEHGIVLVPEGCSAFTTMSVRENLELTETTFAHESGLCARLAADDGHEADAVAGCAAQVVGSLRASCRS